MLIGFFSASISIGVGFVVSYGIFHKLLGPESWKALAALCGSWLGGGSNMLAIQAILDVSEESHGIFSGNGFGLCSNLCYVPSVGNQLL